MTSLLPASSDIYEEVVEESRAERWTALRDAVPAIRTGKRISPAPDVLPFLVFEDGLGMLTPYVANVYELLDGRGRSWMRVRGTYEAVQRGLAFLNMTAMVEPAWHGRVWWNSSQLRFPDLPANDNPILGQIEGITRLSLPFRSDLRRGAFQYDAGALEGDGSRLDDSLLERESGIAVTDAGTLWSFGRTTEIEHTLTEAEGIAIGNWLAPAGTGLLWADMTYPWTTANFPWADSPANQRAALMAAWFEDRPLHAVFRDSLGSVIGYRRCRTARTVDPAFGGVYSFAGQTYAPGSGGTIAYVEAMTDFEDAAGITATSVSMMVGASLAAGIPPGRLWLSPEDVSGGTEIAATPIAIPLRATVREQIKFMLRF